MAASGLAIHAHQAVRQPELSRSAAPRGARMPLVVARALPPSASGGSDGRDSSRVGSTSTSTSTSSSTSPGGKQRRLGRLLLDQARKEVWGGWLSDLLLPLVSDDPGAATPPPVTLPPRALADGDSLFIGVDGVMLHYKECWPVQAAVAAGAAAAAAAAGEAAGITPVATAGDGSSILAQGQQQQQQPALLLVHGFNGSVFNWRTTMQPLADATGCRVIAYDRPPFGLAERPLTWGEPGQALQYNPYSLEGSARLAEGLLEGLGLQSAVAVGHSAGALVCMELAQRRPQLVAGLGFVAPALPTTPENGFTRRANLGQQLRFAITRGLLGNDTLGLRYVRRQILRRRDEVTAGKLGMHTDELEVPQDVIEGYLRPLLADNWDRGSLLNFRAFTMPPTYDYNTLQQPVLLVQGSNDGVLSQNAGGLAKLLHRRPQGITRFTELQGVGHVPMDECPQQLNELLIDFVRQEVQAAA